MGQGPWRFAEQGLVVKGRGDEGEWLVVAHGHSLRVFGEGLEEATCKAPLPSLFVEAPDDAGRAVSEAVSEFNALLAERERNAEQAVRLLGQLLRDAAEEGGSEEAEEDEVVEEEGEYIPPPRVHEASVLPAAGCDEELELAMDRLVESFFLAAGQELALAGSGAAALVLRHCNWDDAEALRRLQASPAELLNEVGVGPGVAEVCAGKCGVCFDNFAFGGCLTLGCNHPFCLDCWRQQLEHVARGGSGGGATVLEAYCPQPGCSRRVRAATYEKLGLSSLGAQYRRALLRSFLEESGAVKKCPGCGRHVLLGPSRPDAGPCRNCSRRFCALCFKEAHGPLTCAELRTWLKLLEDSQQSLLTKWTSRLRNLLVPAEEASARRCPNPQCGVMSQKVEGCLFLTCPRCKEMWCWNCGAWGGGASGRPAPHHVFICTDAPADITWLDGHSSLREDAHFTFHRDLWQQRSQATNDAVEASAELAAAVLEAREVLRFAAAWRFFEHEDAQRRLFEFAEADLERLLEQQGKERQSGPRRAGDGSRQERTLSAALRTQAQAVRSYRRTGVAAV